MLVYWVTSLYTIVSIKLIMLLSYKNTFLTYEIDGSSNSTPYLLENETNDENEEFSKDDVDGVELRVDNMHNIVNDMDEEDNWIRPSYVNNEDVAYEKPI